MGKGLSKWGSQEPHRQAFSHPKMLLKQHALRLVNGTVMQKLTPVMTFMGLLGLKWFMFNYKHGSPWPTPALRNKEIQVKLKSELAELFKIIFSLCSHVLSAFLSAWRWGADCRVCWWPGNSDRRAWQYQLLSPSFQKHAGSSGAKQLQIWDMLNFCLVFVWTHFPEIYSSGIRIIVRRLFSAQISEIKLCFKV